LSSDVNSLNDTLDLTILDSGNPSHAVIFARCNADIAIARLPFEKLAELDATRKTIEEALYGRGEKPTAQQLTQFGQDLFDFVIRDDVKTLYTLLPSTHVRIHLLSDSPKLQGLPWEYFQVPGTVSGPHPSRSVVRIVKTIGVPPPVSLKFSQQVRVLFAYANPQDQATAVSWDDVRQSIDDSFTWSREKYSLEIINEVTKQSLLKALNEKDFDIFHFSGHGTVVAGVGRLILNDGEDKSAYVTAEDLAGIFRGRAIWLAVLSACHTASGNFTDDFSVISETLVKEGIPAVVANQMPVYNQTMAPFVGTLYSQLLKHGDLDQAVNQARVTLAKLLGSSDLAPGEEATLDWGVPTLYRHVAASKMFES
jgi:hypothetical protein